MIQLPGGALLIDTPGMRELQLWEGETGVSAAFEDIETLAAGCRFGNCRHDTEPGCAVKAAAEDGRLAPDRLASYRELRRERDFLAGRQDRLTMRVVAVENATWAFSKEPVDPSCGSTAPAASTRVVRSRIRDGRERAGAGLEPRQADRREVQHPEAVIDFLKGDVFPAQDLGEIERAAPPRDLAGAGDARTSQCPGYSSGGRWVG